ncbi:MAG: ABC transporter permease, partial [Acidimicrobiia bacterium]|nr:ABC transporter permease [Acidimicrobiia bacterium]
MFRATWKGLLGHKLRMALTLLAIVLGVGLVAGSYIFTDTLTRVFDDLFAESFAGIDVQVRRSFEPDLGFALPDRMPESLVADIQSVDGVEEAIGTVAGLITLAGPEEVVGGQGPPTIAGSWAETASPLRIREGLAPISDEQIVIDAATAEREGLRIGDQVTVLALGGPESFRIVGTLGFGGSDNFGGATFVAFEYRTIQRLLKAEGLVDAISIVGDSGLTPEQLIARIAPVLPEGVEAVTAQTAAEEQLANFKQALGFLNTFLLVFGFVALFVGAFLIQNTFQIVVAQRTRELALLRAIGATRTQVSRMVLGEAFLVALVGSLIGVAAGAGLATLIRAAFQAFGGNLPSTTLQILPRTVAIALAAGVGVTLISAYLPARQAGKVPPVAAMRQALSLPSPRSLHRRAIVGGSVLSLGAATLATGLLVTIESEA